MAFTFAHSVADSNEILSTRMQILEIGLVEVLADGYWVRIIQSNGLNAFPLLHPAA
jgi:hypothetical protein